MRASLHCSVCFAHACVCASTFEIKYDIVTALSNHKIFKCMIQSRKAILDNLTNVCYITSTCRHLQAIQRLSQCKCCEFKSATIGLYIHQHKSRASRLTTCMQQCMLIVNLEWRTVQYIVIRNVHFPRTTGQNKFGKTYLEHLKSSKASCLLLYDQGW